MQIRPVVCLLFVACDSNSLATPVLGEGRRSYILTTEAENGRFPKCALPTCRDKKHCRHKQDE